MPANGESSKNYLDNHYEFTQDSTFLYYFGLDKADVVGYLDLDSGEEIIFGDEHSLSDIIWMGKTPTISELAHKVGINKTLAKDKLQAYITRAKSASRRIHFLTVYRPEIKLLLSSLLDANPLNINDLASVELALAVVSMRERKSSQEIEQLELASQIGYLMQTKAMSMCKVGVKEKDIAVEIEAIANKLGKGVSFPSIVTHNGQTLHNHDYSNALKDSRLCLVDCGALSFENYASDLTRTFPVNGKFSEQQKDIYNIVLRASNLAFEISCPDKLYQDIHLEVAAQISQDLIDLGLIKASKEDAVSEGIFSLFMPHGLGHMMGMDVHDMENIGENFVGYDKYTQRSKALGVSSLRLGRRLKPGFVMTVEPGLYFIPDLIASWKANSQDKGMVNYAELEKYLDFGGIRLEDDMLITEDKNRMIGQKRAPSSVEEIENYMKN